MESISSTAGYWLPNPDVGKLLWLMDLYCSLCHCSRRYGDDHDAALDATAMRNIMRTERFKTRDLDVDEEYDNDAGLEVGGACLAESMAYNLYVMWHWALSCVRT
jgi:hypothetical protein